MNDVTHFLHYFFSEMWISWGRSLNTWQQMMIYFLFSSTELIDCIFWMSPPPLRGLTERNTFLIMIFWNLRKYPFFIILISLFFPDYFFLFLLWKIRSAKLLILPIWNNHLAHALLMHWIEKFGFIFEIAKIWRVKFWPGGGGNDYLVTHLWSFQQILFNQNIELQ